MVFLHLWCCLKALQHDQSETCLVGDQYKFPPNRVNQPHARASKLKQICSEEIKMRSIEMSALVRSIQEKGRREFIGRELKVLVTEKNRGSPAGRSDSYMQVVLEGADVPLGDFVSAKITGSTFAYLLGRIG